MGYQWHIPRPPASVVYIRAGAKYQQDQVFEWGFWRGFKMEKTFLLGVGAQKAGTSWLHDYLVDHPACDMGMRKEYHILDALFIPGCKRFRATAHGWHNTPEDTPFADKPRHLQFYDNLDDYFDYFHEIAHQHADTKVVGDITPSYAALPVDALRLVKAEFEKRDMQVKVVFLMRDPVERIWSAVRMLRRKQRNQTPNKPFEMSEADHVLHNHNHRSSILRGRYEVTLANLAAAFAGKDVFVGLYEELFSTAEVARITGFLGIDPIAPDFARKVNVSRKTDPLPDPVLRQVAQFYHATYDAAESAVGHARLAANWPSLAALQDEPS